MVVSPEKKRSKTIPMAESTSILSLPDDLLLSCIARVSRLYYPTLSHVSKRFRALVTSHELYKVRSLSGRTESCLYVCFNNSHGSPWFTLSRNPDNKLLTKERNKSGYRLTRVPFLNFHPARFSNVVAVGSDIYNISERGVSILDCRSHTWLHGPSIPMELRIRTAGVVDRKIYVAGTYRNNDVIPHVISDSEYDYTYPVKLVKVLDTYTQTWDSVSIPSCSYFCNQSFCIDGKFHLVTGQELVAYDSKEDRWDMIANGCGYFLPDSYCEIGNILYSLSGGLLKWYRNKGGIWTCGELKGLTTLPDLRVYGCVRLANYGGNLAVFWDEDILYCGGSERKKKIWCAVIALERRGICEIWGEVEWFDHVLTVPRAQSWLLVKALAVTV